jgi:hypothetical protein
MKSTEKLDYRKTTRLLNNTRIGSNIIGGEMKMLKISAADCVNGLIAEWEDRRRDGES